MDHPGPPGPPDSGVDRAARRSAADPAQKPAFLATVACGEYSPQAQLSALHLDIPLEEPVLDVGCGSQANLARYLADLGVEVLGIDRSAPDELFCQTCAWEEFDYGAGRWGTILSHQSFSTHFTFNHRHSGQERPIEMARTFMRMLAGLRPGGALVYAPGLPFIEPLLEQKTGYNLHRYPIPGIPGALAGIAYACHIHFATNFG